MSNEARIDRIYALFCDCVDLGPAERNRFLADACEGDLELRQELDHLLAAHDDSGDAFETPVAPLALQLLAEEDQGPDGPTGGDRMGSYELVREIGRGGMGRVYLATRQYGDAVQRVAIKLVEPSLRRSLAQHSGRELEALLKLEHPHIARLLTFEESTDGPPFLVLEHVEGEPITTWCDRQAPTLRQRLELFLQVCEAVQYAHEERVLHCDLKPANILVTAAGQVKLLDFGIAELVDPAYADPSEGAVDTPSGATDRDRTQIAQRPLTPDYASPEQIRGERLAATSDVYSLGVLLYELVTGRRPYEVHGMSREEMLAALREPRFPPPSEALATGDGSSKGAPRALRRDVDEIVKTALRPDAAGRYRSAEQLRLDVQRLLNGYPLSVEHPSRLARARKFLGRNWRWAVPAAAFVVLLLASIVVVAGLRSTAVSERDRARTEATRADQEAQTARRVSDLLAGILVEPDPFNRKVRPDATVREILNEAANHVRTGLEDTPEVRARLLDLIGVVQRRLGLFQQAAPSLEEAVHLRERLPGSELALAESLTNLATLYQDLDRLDEAADLLDRALQLRVELLGPDHEDVAKSLNVLAIVEQNRGHFDRAEELFERTLTIRRATKGADHPDVAFALVNLASVKEQLGQLHAATALYRDARDILVAYLGPDHPAVAYCDNHLAMLDLMNGDLEVARTGFERALHLREATLGPKHREVAYVLNNLGEDAMARGDLPTAAENLQRSHDILAESLGPRHPLVAQSLANLGALRLRTGELARSQKLLADARAIYEESAPRDPFLVMILGRQARTFEKAGQPQRATACVHSSLALAADLLAEEPRNRQLAIWQVESQVIAARLLERAGETERARALWDAVLGSTANLLITSNEAALRVARARALLHSGLSEDGCALVDGLRGQGWHDPAFEEATSCPLANESSSSSSSS